MIHFYHDIDQWELYDRKKDPQELDNVYNDSLYTTTKIKLHRDLEDLRKKYGDSDELNKRYLNL